MEGTARSAPKNAVRSVCTPPHIAHTFLTAHLEQSLFLLLRHVLLLSLH